MKLIKLTTLIFLYSTTIVMSDNLREFDLWKLNFKKVALDNNISESTFDMAMSKVKFLPKVIEYDRFQPEFYEDTKTYIKKRTSDKKLKKGIYFYQQNNDLINNIESNFEVEKELKVKHPCCQI